MRRHVHLALLSSLLIAAGVCAAGCTSEPSTPVDATAVRAYADTATDTALQGLSEGDLEKYTRHANDGFKAAVTQEILDGTAKQINSQLGAYQSIEFLKAEEQDGYIIVHYRATYEKGKAGIRMVFDNDQLIAGQWFE
ncbi:MAG: DUF3887 domain-containing protein [Dehalococcoidia bacterium]|jgi:hypothetical protein|nr:DUF3887 domain-containing protein [Dehalococcoidia bacterium]